MAVSEMLTHMEQLLVLHDALLEASEGKRQAIVANQVDQLAAWTSKESRLMKQVTERQSLWRDAVAAFLASRGMKPTSSLTTAQIADMIAPGREKDRLNHLQEQLLGRIQELKANIGRNQRLIEKSLEVINYSVDLLYGDNEQESVYHNPAQTSHSASGARNIRFDTRA